MEIVGQVLSGQFGEILIRQKGDSELELGELLVAEDPNSKLIMQVYNLLYGSQISPKSIELLSGMQLEGHGSDLGFMEANLRNYVLAEVKGLVSLSKSGARIPKKLPPFFSEVRKIESGDLDFLGSEENGLFIGNVRSGSKNLGIPVYLDGPKVLSHHVLIPATTGRGKSNLVRVMAYSAIGKGYCGLLIFDPHDEYYNGPGGKEMGLKDHPDSAEQIVHYSLKPEAGGRSLIINYKLLRPHFFQGVLDLSSAQRDALYYFYKRNKEDWLRDLLTFSDSNNKSVSEASVGVLIRKFSILGIRADGDEIVCSGVFSKDRGETTLDEIVSELSKAKTVIIDSSSLSGETELLVSSMIASRVIEAYKRFKDMGELGTKPVISIILEEAPRVIGKDALESGPNVFSMIAREGRKFKVGLLAITQLPSLIPREILANMNTKIILGIEMEPERNAIIESASQDLSKDGRNIASLDKGEALITSNFTKFAIPISIPLFDKSYVSPANNAKAKKDFSGFN
jgi:uncharacterized protein